MIWRSFLPEIREKEWQNSNGPIPINFDREVCGTDPSNVPLVKVRRIHCYFIMVKKIKVNINTHGKITSTHDKNMSTRYFGHYDNKVELGTTEMVIFDDLTTLIME